MKILRITTRLEDSDRQKIEALIEAGKFRNISSVIRAALARFLNDA